MKGQVLSPGPAQDCGFAVEHNPHLCRPAFSLLNHSCAPNATPMVAGPSHHVVVRASREIAAGEPVTISYIGGSFVEAPSRSDAHGLVTCKTFFPSCGGHAHSVQPCLCLRSPDVNIYPMRAGARVLQPLSVRRSYLLVRGMKGRG